MIFDNEKNTYKTSAMSKILYYSMDKKHSTFFAVRFKLDEIIDKDILQNALDKTIKRFPYFKRKAVFTSKNILIQDNDNPLLVYEEDLDKIINFSTNNDYLIRTQIKDEYLTIQAFHGLTDAFGLYCFFKILLENYYLAKGEELTLNDDIYHQSDVCEEEYKLPDDLKGFENIKPNQEVKKEVFVIDKKDTGFYTNVFSCDAKKFMDYAKLVDGSPNAVLAILLAKAIKNNNPDYDKEINVGVAINVKNIIGLNYSYPPLLNTSNQVFNEKAFSFNIEMLHTIVRGRVIFDSSEDESNKFVANIINNVPGLLNALPSYKSKQLLALQSTNTVRNTATVSYVGKFDFGDVEKHILETYTFCDSKTPIMEISYVNGKFFFSLTAKFDEDSYIEDIKKQCDECGFDTSDIQKISFKVDPGKVKLAKFGLNKETIELVSTVKKLKK